MTVSSGQASEADVYRDVMLAFDAVFDYLRSVGRSLNGRSTTSKRQLVCGRILVKIIAHCTSMRALAPDPSDLYADFYWDPSSLSAISRCVVEAHGPFVHFASPRESSEVEDFEWLLWRVHEAERRVSMSSNLGFGLDTSEARREQVESAKAEVVAHRLFRKVVSGHYHGKWRREGDSVHLALHPRDLCRAENINEGYYSFVMDRLSQDVHTLPYAVEELMKFQAGSNDAIHAMTMPFAFCLPFMARVGLKSRECFGGFVPLPAPKTQRVMDIQKRLSEVGPLEASATTSLAK